MLARAAPTWLCRDRPSGAAAAASAGANLLLMDDGMQTPGLAKDLCVAVVDGGAGFGNGRLLPAGPLREPLACGLSRAHALVLVGADREGALAALGPHDLPVIKASLVPGDEVRALRERPVVAFAGIGRPEKFFETLAENGCNVIARHAFADHHRYKPKEIAAIVDYAKKRDAVPVTTEKDHVRLLPDARAAVRTLSVALALARPGRAAIPAGAAGDALPPWLSGGRHARRGTSARPPPPMSFSGCWARCPWDGRRLSVPFWAAPSDPCSRCIGRATTISSARCRSFRPPRPGVAPGACGVISAASPRNTRISTASPSTRPAGGSSSSGATTWKKPNARHRRNLLLGPHRQLGDRRAHAGAGRNPGNRRLQGGE